jgi:hypothetical protein
MMPDSLYGGLCGFLVRKFPFPLASPPCLPSPSQKAPSGSAWIHEIKHDGYRLLARKDCSRVPTYLRVNASTQLSVLRCAVETYRSFRIWMASEATIRSRPRG